MKRIAAPMLGGVGAALVLVLIVFPAIFSFWRGRGLPKDAGGHTFANDEPDLSQDIS
jgi:hypothetical protein